MNRPRSRGVTFAGPFPRNFFPSCRIALVPCLMCATPFAAWHKEVLAGSIVLVHCGPACDGQIPQPNTDFIAVSAGNYQTLGLRADGSAVAWGFCGKDSCDVPNPNSGFTAIACGDAFNLFMRPGGVIHVTGSNEAGQYDVPLPNSGYVAFAAGLLHAVAIRADGSIAAWGYCGPHVPEPNSEWVAVAAGGYSSMGLKSDGTLYKWGCFFEPGEVIQPGTQFKAMACHADHALAVRQDGSIYAWGSNQFGQLNVPEPNASFVAVAATYQGSVGLKTDGTIVTWGNIAGVAAPNHGFVAIAADNLFAYALRSSACQNHGDCDDGNICNGIETCDTNGYCVPGMPACASGDVNCDQAIDLDDVAPFVAHLLEPSSGQPCEQSAADVNADGLLNGNDVSGFVGCVLAAGCP